MALGEVDNEDPCGAPHEVGAMRDRLMVTLSAMIRTPVRMSAPSMTVPFCVFVTTSPEPARGSSVTPVGRQPVACGVGQPSGIPAAARNSEA